MGITQRSKVAPLLLALGVPASGAEPRPEATRADDVPASVVKPGKLRVTVTERGSLEAARSARMQCKVESGATIVSILPEGTNLKKGQVVCQLDSSALRDQHNKQAISTREAEVSYTESKLAREAAETDPKADLARKRAEELARKSTWEQETRKEAWLRDQIANCTIFAPCDGALVLANDPNRVPANRPPQITVNARVRNRQIIGFVTDLSELVVNTKVHESLVDQVAPGQRVKTQVDAFPVETLNGAVVAVMPLPDPEPVFGRGPKVYTTKVSIEKGRKELRPGMTAQVEIQVADLDNVLSVPIMAVLVTNGRTDLFVKTPDGAFERREVTVGVSNETRVEVKQGLRSGEAVVSDPIPLLSAEERRRLDEPIKPSERPVTKAGRPR